MPGESAELNMLEWCMNVTDALCSSASSVISHSFTSIKDPCCLEIFVLPHNLDRALSRSLHKPVLSNVPGAKQYQHMHV